MPVSPGTVQSIFRASPAVRQFEPAIRRREREGSMCLKRVRERAALASVRASNERSVSDHYAATVHQSKIQIAFK